MIYTFHGSWVKWIENAFIVQRTLSSWGLTLGALAWIIYILLQRLYLEVMIRYYAIKGTKEMLEQTEEKLELIKGVYGHI